MRSNQYEYRGKKPTRDKENNVSFAKLEKLQVLRHLGSYRKNYGALTGTSLSDQQRPNWRRWVENDERKDGQGIKTRVQWCTKKAQLKYFNCHSPEIHEFNPKVGTFSQLYETLKRRPSSPDKGQRHNDCLSNGGFETHRARRLGKELKSFLFLWNVAPCLNLRLKQ